MKRTVQLNSRWVLICAFLVSALTVAIWKSPIGDVIDVRFVHNVIFWARDKSGHSPKVDDRLKIYAIDDRTIGKTKSSVLSFEQWKNIFQTLAINEPSVIVVDQLFSTVQDTDEELSRAVDSISILPVTVVTGALLTTALSKVPLRDSLEVDQFPKYWLEGGGFGSDQITSSDAEMPQVKATGFNVYGPQANLRAALNRIGHLMYSGTNTIDAFYELDSRHAVPHASFLVSSGLKVRDGALFVGESRVPIRPDGALLVNFVSTEAFHNQFKVKSMQQLLDIVESGEQATLADKGDVVLILNHMYTGHTDFASTPFGQMPAGLILGSMINSVLSGNWIRTDRFGILWISLAALAGGFSAFLVGGAAFFSLGLIVNLFIVAIGLAIFTKFGLLVDWLPAMVAFSASAAAVFIHKKRASDRVSLGVGTKTSF